MKKVLALSLALLTFVMPVNAGWFDDWQDHRFKEKKEQLWAKLQRQIVEIDKQIKIQNQAADKLDNHPDADDFEANKEYKIETIKYWEKRKNAAMTAIRYNELVGDKDNLEREKGYVAEAQRNIELLSAKLNDESSEPKVSFSSKVSNGFHGVAGFISRHREVIVGIVCGCVAAYMYYTYKVAPARATRAAKAVFRAARDKMISVVRLIQAPPTYEDIINKLDNGEDARIYRGTNGEYYTQVVRGLNGNTELRGELSMAEVTQAMSTGRGPTITELAFVN